MICNQRVMFSYSLWSILATPKLSTFMTPQEMIMCETIVIKEQIWNEAKQEGRNLQYPCYLKVLAYATL